MSRRRASPRHGGRPPRRGDGVPALEATGQRLVPTPPPADPTGRRPLDFGGPLWRWLLILSAIALVAALAGPALGACILVLQDQSPREYLEAMSDWTVKVVGGLIGLGLIALVRRQGTTQRSQKTTVENAFATAQRVDEIGQRLAALDRRHEALATTVADALGRALQPQPGDGAGEAAQRLAAALAELEDLLDFAARTGPLATVQPDPPPAAPDPEPEPVVATVVRVERHADTLPPLRPLPAAATTSGHLRPVTGPVPTPSRAHPPQVQRPAGGVVEGDVLEVEVLDPRLAAEEERRASAWGPGGRPAWADGRGAEPDPTTRTDALSALLGRPRPRGQDPSTTSSILRQVDALEADYAVADEPSETPSREY